MRWKEGDVRRQQGKNVNATFHNLAKKKKSLMDLSANTCSTDNGCTLQ